RRSGPTVSDAATIAAICGRILRSAPRRSRLQHCRGLRAMANSPPIRQEPRLPTWASIPRGQTRHAPSVLAMQTRQRVALLGILVSAALAVVKIYFGLRGHSTAVVADGLESTGDVFASGLVLFGLTLAAKPPDADHPYGHGRVEILSGLLIG